MNCYTKEPPKNIHKYTYIYIYIYVYVYIYIYIYIIGSYLSPYIRPFSSSLRMLEARGSPG